MKNEEKKQAVIYCRVSTKEQAEEGNSLVTQQRICQEYAVRQQYNIQYVFIEQGESAKTTDRTELQRMLKYCTLKKNNIDAIIVYKIDRLSRNTDDYSQIRILLKRYNIEIKSTSETFEDNPVGRFMENIMANVAQFDNDVRTERCVGGMKEAVKEGRYVWMAPFGYSNTKTNEKSTIMPNDKASIIRDTFELVAQGNMTIDQVRQYMFHKGLTANQKQPLAKGYFYRMLTNELYVGWIKKFGIRQKGNFESIISETLFAKVQQVLESRSHRYSAYKIKNPDFPLRRFVKSPSGKTLTGSWSKGKLHKYAYYRFAIERLNFGRDIFENKFVDLLNQYSLDSWILTALKKKIQAYYSNREISKIKLVNTREQMLASLKEKRGLLIEKNLDGIINDEILKEKLAEIQSEIYQHSSKEGQEANALPDLKEVFQILSGVLKNPGNTWLELDFTRKLNFQVFYFPAGLVFDGKEFRTPKVSSIFKLKDLVWDQKYSKVDHQFKKKNTLPTITIPVLHEGASVVQEQEDKIILDVTQELAKLFEIITTKPDHK